MPTMFNPLPLIKKEVRSYFNSPVAYIAIVFFLIFSSVKFFLMEQFFLLNVASLRSYFTSIPGIFVFLIPSLTMRLWSEEKKMGTDEILYTLPFSETELVIGKYLGVFSIVFIMLFLTLPIPFFLEVFGDFEWGAIWGEYLGVLLLASVGISLGQFISSLTSNQFSAFIATTAVLLVTTSMKSLISSASVPPVLLQILSFFSLDYHFESFRKGLLDTRDLVFFVVLSALFLYLTVRLIKIRKWR
jgi:ABC-2 type transport system permease protein